MEKVGDKLNIVDKQAENDLNRFKAFIEDEGYATAPGAERSTKVPLRVRRELTRRPARGETAARLAFPAK